MTWFVVHTRDSGKPVLLNTDQCGCMKPAKAPEKGTAVWVLGRQEPFYIREPLSDFTGAENFTAEDLRHIKTAEWS